MVRALSNTFDLETADGDSEILGQLYRRLEAAAGQLQTKESRNESFRNLGARQLTHQCEPRKFNSTSDGGSVIPGGGLPGYDQLDVRGGQSHQHPANCQLRCAGLLPHRQKNCAAWAGAG